VMLWRLYTLTLKQVTQVPCGQCTVKSLQARSISSSNTNLSKVTLSISMAAVISDAVFRQETDLLSLAEKIKDDKPYSCSIYNQLILSTCGHLDWSDFFVLSNQTDSHIILYVAKNKEDYGVHCLEEEVPLLVESLRSTHLIDWHNNMLCFFHVYEYLVPAMQELALDKVGRKFGSGPCNVYIFTDDKQLSCPSEFQIKLLGEAGIRRMFDTWKYSIYSDYSRFHRIARAGLACGVYQMLDSVAEAQNIIPKNIITASEEEIPLSWITMSTYGALGLLMTDENYRHKSLGSLVTQACGKLVHQQGFVPHVYIEDYNDPSIKMFEKLQWNKSHRATWLFMRT
ncbi:unnamed protein product, partial [Meganyctiphanes norvegica]